jgi:hypothetical protein
VPRKSQSTGKQAAQRAALYAWRKDGEPERVRGDSTSVGRSDYERQAQEVIGWLLACGYTVVRPRI